MKKLLCTILCMFVCTVYSYGQTYLYSSRTEDVYNKDNSCKIGEEYIKSKFVPNRWKYERHSAAVYNFPNKNKLVVINYSVSYTEKQTLRSTNGNGFYTNNGWTNEVSKLKENKENVYHAVLIDSKGSPLKAIKVCGRFVLAIFTNSNFLMIASKDNESSRWKKNDYIYTNIMCFNKNGDEMWIVRPGDMAINDYDFWQDKLYVVGDDNYYSYYRIIDLNSGNIVEETKVNKNCTFSRIDIKSDGINLEEKLYSGDYCKEVKTYKANHSTQLLSCIQSAKSKEQSLLKRKEYEDRTKYKFEKINELIESIDYAYNDYFRVLKLNPRFTAQQRNNWRDEKINSIKTNLDYVNKTFDEITKMAEKYGLSEEISIINAKKKALNNETGDKIRKMGGIFKDEGIIQQEEDSTPKCWACGKELSSKDLSEGYHIACGSFVFKCKKCNRYLNIKDVNAKHCQKCGTYIY